MTEPRSYLDERIAQRRRRALGALAVAGAMAATALWVLGGADTVDTRPLAVVSTTSG